MPSPATDGAHERQREERDAEKPDERGPVLNHGDQQSFGSHGPCTAHRTRARATIATIRNPTSTALMRSTTRRGRRRPGRPKRRIRRWTPTPSTRGKGQTPRRRPPRQGEEIQNGTRCASERTPRAIRKEAITTAIMSMSWPTHLGNKNGGNDGQDQHDADRDSAELVRVQHHHLRG